jgi:drug/metabolite transporter (DMT)-like permease
MSGAATILTENERRRTSDGNHPRRDAPGKRGGPPAIGGAVLSPAAALRQAAGLLAVAYIACALIWSTTWFVIRVCIGPGGYPTFAAAALRFAVATAVLAALAGLGLAGRGPRSWGQRAWVGAAGVACGVGYGLVYSAETRISGGLAAVIFSTFPLMTAVVTTLTRTERPTPAAVVGSAIGVLGIWIIYRDRMNTSADQAIGVGLVFGAVVVTSIYTLWLKRHTRDTDPLATNGYFLGAAAVALALFALVHERQAPPWPPPLRPTLALLYLGVVGSVIVFAVYFYLLKRMTLMAASTLVFIEPVLALLIDALWEHEIRLAPATYLGAAVTLVGVAVSLLIRPRAPSSAPGPAT